MESDPRTRRRRHRRHRRHRRLAQAPDDLHACDFVFVPDRRTDEYFTLTIGGPATILNNSKDVIHAGDTIAWTFYSEHKENAKNPRANHGSVRRIGIRIADLYAIFPVFEPNLPCNFTHVHTHTQFVRLTDLVRSHDENKIGKAINFAKPGQTFDILVQI